MNSYNIAFLHLSYIILFLLNDCITEIVSKITWYQFLLPLILVPLFSEPLNKSILSLNHLLFLSDKAKQILRRILMIICGFESCSWSYSKSHLSFQAIEAFFIYNNRYIFLPGFLSYIYNSLDWKISAFHYQLKVRPEVLQF